MPLPYTLTPSEKRPGWWCVTMGTTTEHFPADSQQSAEARARMSYAWHESWQEIVRCYQAGDREMLELRCSHRIRGYDLPGERVHCSYCYRRVLREVTPDGVVGS